MRHLLFSLFCLVSPLLLAQATDPIAQQVDSLILVSRAHTDHQKFAQALEASAAAEQLARLRCGRASAAYGSACFNQGRVFYFKGDYDDAAPWYLQSVEIRGAILGKAHPDYGKSVNNLAILYDVMGQYEKAEPLYQEALALREKAFGRQSAAYAAALSNLASLYMQMGEYEPSERLNLEAKDIREKVLGKAHPDYASSLNNLANLYYAMGVYDNAESMHIESKAIREAAGDTLSSDYILGLDNLGATYQLMARYDRAEWLFQKALDLRAQTLGDEHPSYILSISHLAGLYRKKKDYLRAETLFEQSRALGAKILGKAHQDYATNLLNFAELQLDAGRFGQATALLLEANAVFEKKLGRDNALFASGLDLLARSQWASGDLAAAKPLLLEASQIKKHLLLKTALYLPVRELAAFVNTFKDRLNADFSFARRDPSVAAACYDDALFHKGFLLNAASKTRQLALKNPANISDFNLLASYQRLLAAQYARPIEERQGVAALEEKAIQAEKSLVRNLPDLGAALQQVGWQAVQAVLKPDEAAIEFVHYQLLDPNPTDKVLHAALLLLPDGAMPRFVSLFEEKQLESLLKTEDKLPPAFLNELYSSGTKGSQLYGLLWQPLADALPAGVRKIYFSPSGLLHRLNLGALPTPEGKVLSERYRLVELGSTRQLAIPTPLQREGESLPSPPGEACLFGGIQYDFGSNAPASNGPQVGELTARHGSDFSQVDATLRGNAWGYLKWTEVEVSAAEELLKSAGFAAVTLRGLAATEESFKAFGTELLSPRVLHLATHGYFFPDPQSEKVRSEKVSGQEEEQMRDEKTFEASENPMIRSGLVLAGGNYAWKTGKPLRPELEDGILTAYEISQMNLSNTELVVLSACETGLGEIEGNEGVYGLQRAFKIAGARYLIMSLWQVPDFQTQEFMTAFYMGWLEQKMSVSEAFRAAQSELRAQYGEAFYWAGFVLLE
jgi:CHAT domain-containing protein